MIGPYGASVLLMIIYCWFYKKVIKFCNKFSTLSIFHIMVLIFNGKNRTGSSTLKMETVYTESKQRVCGTCVV